MSLKDYEPDSTKPLVNKVKTTVTITDDSPDPVSNVTLSGFDGIDNFTMNGKRYGKRFFLRTDSGDKAKFILGSCTIVKKTGAASTISGVLGQIDTVSIGEARFTGKRAPI